jgi:hypothetical protein
VSNQTTNENQDSEETSSPQSPQEPTETAPENTTVSEPSTMPSEAPEAPGEGFNGESTNSALGKDDTHIVVDPPSNEVEEPETSNEQAEPVRAQPKPSLAKQLLVLARNAIQFRKRKKLDKVMSLFLKHSKITNDEVEKFLHVSDATATRYLSQLEKEGRIKQSGKTGKGVSYSRII